MADVKICDIDELPEGSTRIVRIADIEIAVIHENSGLYAYRNLCPHQGGPACEGIRMPGVVEIIDEAGRYLGKRYDDEDIHIICPWHGYAFHLKDGRNVCDPALRLQKFRVWQEEDGVYVTV